MDRNQRLLYSDLDLKLHMGNLSINVLNINYEPPISLRAFKNHNHSSYELHFIPEGKGILRIFQNTYNITPGTFYLTGPGIYHEQLSDRYDPMVEYCINFEFTVSKKLGSKGEFKEIADILSKTNFWFGKDVFATHECFQKIFYEMDHQLLGYYTNIQNYASQIVINAVRCYAGQRKADYLIPRKMTYDKRRTVLDNFFRDYQNQLKPAELATMLGVSVRQLDRIIHYYYSMSFKEKLTSTRLDISKDLLANTDLTVDEISLKAGFSSSSYFCKIFKERFDITPTEYRKKK